MKKNKNRLEETATNNNKTIVCLKWGEKYSPHYVNVLYSMCRRHSTVPFNFICLTENHRGISPEINIKPLPQAPFQGWWFKPYVFSRDLNLKGDVMFLDLDLVVFDNIDKLWNHEAYEFAIIRDFTRHMNPAWQKFNSSVFRFNAETSHWLWDFFSKNYRTIVTKNHGDQDYLYAMLKDRAKHWPDAWIRSYKWEMRDKHDLSVINGKRNFAEDKQPRIEPGSCIAVFHGDPNPADCRDRWVIDNWK